MREGAGTFSSSGRLALDKDEVTFSLVTEGKAAYRCTWIE